MADPWGQVPKHQGNYVTIQNEANGQSTRTEYTSSQESLATEPTQPNTICDVDIEQPADGARIVSGEESNYYPYTTFLRNTVVVRSGECCPPKDNFGYSQQRSRSSTCKKCKKSSTTRNLNYQDYDNRSLVEHDDENLTCYQPQRKSSRHSCCSAKERRKPPPDNSNAPNRSSCCCPPPMPKPMPCPKPPSKPPKDCCCDPPPAPSKRCRSRSKSRERVPEKSCACPPKGGGRRGLRSGSAHYMEYQDFQGSSPGPKNPVCRKRGKSLNRKESNYSCKSGGSRGRRKHRTDPPNQSYYLRERTLAAQQCGVRRHAQSHLRGKCSFGRSPPPPQKRSCPPPYPTVPPPSCKNPKCKNNPAKKSCPAKKKKQRVDRYAGDNGCGLPTDYIIHSRSQQSSVRNPVTCCSDHYIRGGYLPHETHYDERGGQCPRKRARSTDRCSRSAPACSNETMMEKPVQSYRYSCPENGRNSRRSPPCQRRGERVGKRCAAAMANRCCPLCGMNAMMPKPSIRSLADPTNKKSRTIYKSMTPPACRPRPKRKSNKYNLTICYKAKNRCQGGKNSHYSPLSLSSALRRRAKVAQSGVQIETPKSISFKDGGKLEQQFTRPMFVTKAYHALPLKAGFLFDAFSQARTLSISPTATTPAQPNQIKVQTPTPLLGSRLSHPPSKASPVHTKPSAGTPTLAPSTSSKKQTSSVASPAARSVILQNFIADPPAQSPHQKLPKASVDPKKTVAQKSAIDGLTAKDHRSQPENITKSLTPAKNLRSSLGPPKPVRAPLELAEKALKPSPELVKSPPSPLEKSTKSLRFPAEEPDKTKKSPPEKSEKSEKSKEPPFEQRTKSRRSPLHELRSDTDGHNGPKHFRSPFNVHTSSCLKNVEYPRTVETQMSLPAARGASYLGTEINPFYRGSFLKVRVSKEFQQSHLNPISQRTKKIEEEKKPKREWLSLHAPSFSTKNLMKLVFGDPFVRMGANPHYTFSWKKLFSFNGRSKSQNRSKVGLKSVPSGSNKG
ncbi:hypothetical protein KR067_013416 [Drosophila pandora]|nr:hypothetical protein KR067_013416 [Drosophila pandora]